MSNAPGGTTPSAIPDKSKAPSASGLISRLEKELRDLWKAPEDPSEAPLSRVCTMNIEVVAPSAELLERYTPVVDEVTSSIGLVQKSSPVAAAWSAFARWTHSSA